METIEPSQGQWLIIAHRDRLMRFSFESLQTVCRQHHTDLLIVTGKRSHELMQGLLATV